MVFRYTTSSLQESDGVPLQILSFAFDLVTGGRNGGGGSTYSSRFADSACVPWLKIPIILKSKAMFQAKVVYTGVKMICSLKSFYTGHTVGTASVKYSSE